MKPWIYYLAATIVFSGTQSWADATSTERALLVNNQTDEYLCEIHEHPYEEGSIAFLGGECLEPEQSREIVIAVPPEKCVVTLTYQFDDVGETIADPIDICTIERITVSEVGRYYD